MIRSFSRRSFLVAGGSFLLPQAAQGQSRFRFRQGIGFAPDGPNMSLYAPGGHFPEAQRSNWYLPSHAIESFSNLDRIFPVSRSLPGAARAFGRASREPSLPHVLREGVRLAGVDDYLDRNPALGLLIGRGDTILVERYQYGRNEQNRFTSFSMAKTLVAIMCGLALSDGRIRSLDDPAERYVADLRGLAYGQTPLRHLLTMSSGVQFREEYNGRDDVTELSRATLGRMTSGGAAAVRAFNQRIAAPGTRWYYASAETYVLAHVLRAALGRSLASYFEERIWRPIGAEASASWLVDASGCELGYMGFHAVLRDYARLGRMLAERGRVDGREIIPAQIFRHLTHPHFSPSATGRYYGYGQQVWIFPDAGGSFALLGVRGQMLLVDPRTRSYLVHSAARPESRDPRSSETIALWRAVLSSA